MSKINKFLFGDRRAYKIYAGSDVFTVAGTHYRCTRGMLTVRDNWTKVATFTEFKSIVEQL